MASGMHNGAGSERSGAERKHGGAGSERGGAERKHGGAGIALSVNLNKIALIRNSRDTAHPSVPLHAEMAIAAGADGITAHPRPDQRHIRATDCLDLAQLVATSNANRGSDGRGSSGGSTSNANQGSKTSGESASSANRTPPHPVLDFNIEGNPFAGPRRSERTGVGDYPGFMALVREARPHQCTLVPDGDTQLTSDHGFDLKRDGDRIAPIVEELQALGIRTSLFMDPEPEQIRLAAQTGTDRIELYTESYAYAFSAGTGIDAALEQFRRAAESACDLDIGVNAGHGLNLDNLPRLAEIPGLLEVSIGHALTVDAIRMGFANAIAAYQQTLGKA